MANRRHRTKSPETAPENAAMEAGSVVPLSRPNTARRSRVKKGNSEGFEKLLNTTELAERLGWTSKYVIRLCDDPVDQMPHYPIPSGRYTTRWFLFSEVWAWVTAKRREGRWK